MTHDEFMSILPTLDAFADAYLEAILWTEDGPDGRPLSSSRGLDAFTPDAARRAADECRAFREANADDLDALGDDRRAGYLFWLTRGGHGHGFWALEPGEFSDKCAADGGAERLADAAHAAGERYVHVDDDGEVHVQ